MASIEDREKHRRRMKNKIARDLRTKYKQRTVEDKQKRSQLKDLSHAALVRLIQEENLD